MPKKLTPQGQAAPPVDPIVTGAQLPVREAVPTPRKRPRTTDSGVRYIRNLHHIQTIIRLVDKREIKLAPRGQREDMDVVSKADQQDPKYLQNKGMLFEVLTVEDAQKVIEKQQYNARKQESSLFDHLLNAQGQPYTQKQATIEEAFERQAIVVGTIEETSGTAHVSHDAEVRRVSGPQQTSVPGSPGHPATEHMLSVPGSVSPEEYHEFLLWKQFKAEQANREPTE